ncbi:energy transducer TonB [Uliginosibacterium sediminicola]|uniref:Energy transducer TonB n=1 Tax=Uliginosibacterium sediminicola TaxID=2024550 RepID=A0ABU9Z3J3_9RHOO
MSLLPPAGSRLSVLALCAALHLLAGWALMQLIMPEAHRQAWPREQIISVRWFDLAKAAAPAASTAAMPRPAAPRPPAAERPQMHAASLVSGVSSEVMQARVTQLPVEPPGARVQPPPELPLGSAPAPVARVPREIESPANPAPLEAARPDHAWNPPPDYPSLLREQGVGGTVWLRVQVLQDGSAGQVELWRSSGYRLLDEAALRAARQWRFKPARRGDQTLASWVEFPVRFTLDG